MEPVPSRKPLRLWPGVAAAILIVVARLVVPLFAPHLQIPGVLGAAAGAAIILVWWLLFSRAPWLERIGAVALIAVGILVLPFVVDKSIAGGMQGFMVPMLAAPATVFPMLVVWAVATRNVTGRARWVTMALAIVIGCGVWTLLRTEGVQGESMTDLHWRWTPTAEERLLAQEKTDPPPIPPAAAPAPAVSVAPGSTPAAPDAIKVPPPAIKGGEWPGFRGADRDGVVDAVRIATDWAASPPRELWRRPIGPGWSSFAVHGDLIYTQEQRGEHEVVSSYRLSTGQPVWRHRDAARFYESNGGPGPRATPTVHDGRVYTLGATGIVNALDAERGTVIWSRNAQADTGAPEPGWGFTGSPLVFGDRLIVATSGRLVAYDLAKGTPLWTRPTGGGGYSSPHAVTIGGVPQVVLLSGGGATSVAPADGTVLWDVKGETAVGIVQPTLLPGGDLLIAAGDAMGGLGLRRISVAQADGAWTVKERWTSRGLKPYFNDYVVHEGHAFGFDGTILSCVDIETGERKWKGGRYGAGQAVLLPEQDLLLVLSEDGDLVLVKATADGHAEVAKFKAIEGKTWNHPVVVGELVLVRNGEEMAAFRLPPR